MNKKYIGIAAIIVGVGVIFFTTQHIKTSSRTSVILQVPFSSQAPNSNWDRNEDCEETSIMMANAYLTGSTEDKLPREAAQNAINTLKTWEAANLGYNANTGAEATTRMAEGAFGLKIKKITDYTEKDLKNAIDDHHPVLLPINARLLGNPKYQDTGPLYHMVVVRGYDAKGFYVNDPGTEGGDGNQYTYDILKKAAADWNQVTKQMEPQSKIALVVSK